MTESIQHISDTAFLVAAMRAVETDLVDPLMNDPLARRLAGDRGAALLSSAAPSRWRTIGIGMRTRFIDEFVASEVNGGHIDCVLSMGAGLDARPWRLPLPGSLRWIEADFAPVLDYKHGVLRDVIPHCRLERLTTDLNNADDRRRVLAEALRSGRVLLLTEGLLFYLPAETVHSLAVETAGCSRWILDIPPAIALLLAIGGDSMRQADQLRHQTRLEGAAILQALCDGGWQPAASRTFVKDGAPFAIARMQREGWTPDPKMPRPPPDDPAGVWLLKRD